MLITRIKYLVNVLEENKLLRGHALAELPVLEDAFLKIVDDKISDYGLMRNLQEEDLKDEVMDARQASVLPCWCDSHSHLVFAGSREQEFIDKIKGLSYAEMLPKAVGY